MTARSRGMTAIYIAPVGTALTALATSTYKVAGEILSYTKSGGERDNETVHAFGGDIDKEKPLSQMEIEMEVVPVIEGTNSNRWDAMFYAQDTANTATPIYTMAASTSTQPSDRLIGIQITSGTDLKSYVFNNCNSVKLDLEHNADDNQTGTIGFKFSPITQGGVSNFMTAKTGIASLPAFSALDNN